MQRYQWLIILNAAVPVVDNFESSGIGVDNLKEVVEEEAWYA
jgi:hypothetical protein